MDIDVLIEELPNNEDLEKVSYISIRLDVLLATIAGFLWPLYLGFLLVSFIYRKYITKPFNRLVDWLKLKLYGDTE